MTRHRVLGIVVLVGISLLALSCTVGIGTATPDGTPSPTHTPTPTATQSPSPTPGRGNWSLKSSRDLQYDSITTVGTLSANTGITLILRCQRGRLDAYISWNTFLGLDDPVLTVRLGDAPAKTEVWLNSINNEISFESQPYLFINKLLSADNRFVAQVTPNSGSPITAAFNLNGIENVLPEILRYCS